MGFGFSCSPACLIFELLQGHKGGCWSFCFVPDCGPGVLVCPEGLKGSSGSQRDIKGSAAGCSAIRSFLLTYSMFALRSFKIPDAETAVRMQPFGETVQSCCGGWGQQQNVSMVAFLYQEIANLAAGLPWLPPAQTGGGLELQGNRTQMGPITRWPVQRLPGKEPLGWHLD